MLVVVVCALAAMWWQASATDEAPVLALRNPVERGDAITVDDLQVVGLASNDALAVLSEAQAGLVIGRVARTDLPAGALITAEQFSDGSLIGAGDGVVGLSLAPGQFPSLALSPGDWVAVVLTPAAGDPRAFDDDTIGASVLVEHATVAEVAEIGVQGQLFVAVQVGEADAARVASAASADRVRLIRVAEDR
ncbi:MAG: SAF domain-containing protein [Actinomycetota bacterium]|nr:SAF domain-containing protein [Actinomycetota bacterium]